MHFEREMFSINAVLAWCMKVILRHIKGLASNCYARALANHNDFKRCTQIFELRCGYIGHGDVQSASGNCCDAATSKINWGLVYASTASRVGFAKRMPIGPVLRQLLLEKECIVMHTVL